MATPQRATTPRTPLPLAGHEVLASTDLDEIRDVVGRYFTSHTLAVAERHAPSLATRMCSLRLGDTSLNTITYGTDITVTPGRLEDFYTLHLLLAGHTGFRCGDATFTVTTSSGVIVAPTEPLWMRLTPDCAHLICRIERGSLGAHLAERTGLRLHTPLVFAHTLDLATTTTGRRLRTLLTQMVRQVDHTPAADDATGARIAAVRFERTLMNTLLAVPNSYTDALAAATPAAAPSRTVWDAVNLLASQPRRPHTLTSVAAHLDVTPDSLHQGMRHELGLSLEELLDDIRLRRVYEDLRSTDPDTTSIADTVRHWGLVPDAALFARYGHHFGETPTDTHAGLPRTGRAASRRWEAAVWR